MKAKIKVRMGANGPVFMPGMPRVLDDQGQDVNVIREEAVEVENNRYYRRRIAKGDLVLVEET